MGNLRATYYIQMKVFVRSAENTNLPCQRDVEDEISNLLLQMPGLDDGADRDVSGTSLPPITEKLGELPCEYCGRLCKGPRRKVRGVLRWACSYHCYKQLSIVHDEEMENGIKRSLV